MITLTLTKDDHDQRADRYIHKQLDASKAVIQKWFRKGLIRRDGAKLAPSDRVYEGEVLVCRVDAEFRQKSLPRGKGRPLDIVYEDERLLLFIKPPQMLSHAASGKEYGNNAVDWMLRYLMERGDYVPRTAGTYVPGIANRLDRNTGGILIGCKTYEAAKDVNRLMRDGAVLREYLALTTGRPPTPGIYTADWLKGDNLVVELDTGKGKTIRTEIVTSEPVGPFHLVTVRLHTGRMHQIRAHLAALGAPLAGDPKYATEDRNRIYRTWGMQHQYLFAHRIAIDPKDEKDVAYRLDVVAPLPKPWNDLLNRLKRSDHEQI